jgi:hypothetical protein
LVYLFQPAVTLKCLKKEDVGQKLWNHLVEHKLLELLPLKEWFACCFANVLPGLSFQRWVAVSAMIVIGRGFGLVVRVPV